MAWGAAPHIIPVSGWIIRYSKMVQAMVYYQLVKTLAIFRAFWKYRPKAGELTVLKFRFPFILPNIHYKTFKSTAML